MGRRRKITAIRKMTNLKRWLDVMAVALVLSLHFPVCTGSYQRFQFVQQWDPAVCRKLAADATYAGRPPPRAAYNACAARAGAFPRFTIHGLWPVGLANVPQNSRYPCLTPRTRFKRNAIDWILARKLSISWPNLLGGNYYFWEEEWKKHGTCSVLTYNQAQYFERAHNMWNDINLNHILRFTILYSRHSPVHEIQVIRPIQAVTKKVPLLRCFRDSAGGWWLWEVVICYEYNGIDFEDCPSTRTRCPSPFYL